jgi:hypothetical protein
MCPGLNLQVLQSLSHQGIPQYLDYFEHETASDKSFYLVQVGRSPQLALSTAVAADSCLACSCRCLLPGAARVRVLVAAELPGAARVRVLVAAELPVLLTPRCQLGRRDQSH